MTRPFRWRGRAGGPLVSGKVSAKQAVAALPVIQLVACPTPLLPIVG